MQDNSRRALRNMRDLVMNYLSFRVSIRFKNGKNRFFYGQEWSCTLSQVINKRVPEIELNKEAGYIDLLKLVDSCKGRFYSAKIYSGKDCTFTKLHRHYNENGDLVDCDDPVFTDENRKVSLLCRYQQSTASYVLEKLEVDFAKAVEQSLASL